MSYKCSNTFAVLPFHYRYNMYVESPFLESPRFHRIFRKRFRMPYRCFQELAAMLAESPLFERWRDGKADAFDRPTTPLPLLVLCCLRYIGRGWTFDDLSEKTLGSLMKSYESFVTDSLNSAVRCCCSGICR
jgi:hypothetical protein